MRYSIIFLTAFLAPVLAAPAQGSEIQIRGGHEHSCEPKWHWDDSKNCCVEDNPPPPVNCPTGLRYDPKTMKCYNPAAHPSKDNCQYLGKDYDEHKKSCVDKPKSPAPAPPAPKPTPTPMPQTCPAGLRYDTKTKKCYNPAAHPSEDNCQYIGKNYDEHKKCCVDKPKSASKPGPTKSGPSKRPTPKPQTCPDGLLYDPKTMKCYNPSRHPSEDNCKYLGKCFDAHTVTCVACEPSPDSCSKGLRYDSATKKCYDPLKHPSKNDCAWAGKYYDEHKKCCVDHENYK